MHFDKCGHRFRYAGYGSANELAIGGRCGPVLAALPSRIVSHGSVLGGWARYCPVTGFIADITAMFGLKKANQCCGGFELAYDDHFLLASSSTVLVS